MHARLVAAVVIAVDDWGGGRKVEVRAVCRQLGVAPKTFYKWAHRYEQEGLAGLEEHSRRPDRSPARLSPVVEDAIVELRKRLSDDGLDCGAGTIRWHLCSEGTVRPPSEATIWRVLVRRGLVAPEPRKRPKSSLRRFEAPAPNEWWQIDATEWELAGGDVVQIFNVLDDHSRLCVQSLAVRSATTEGAWEAFQGGVGRYGLPRGCLSDNGLAFSGRLRGFEVFFEVKLREAGVRPITARAYHPQTCGKVERFQQTLKKWLRARRRRAQTLVELQAQLDEFRAYYNHQRPHRGIGRQTPWDRFSTSPPASPPTVPIPAPEWRIAVTVNAVGVASARRWDINVGAEHANKSGLVLISGTHADVLLDGEIVRSLELDTARRYQGSGRPSGRRPRTT